MQRLLNLVLIFSFRIFIVLSFKVEFVILDSLLMFCMFDFSDASFGYPGGPLLFKNLNFGIDLDSRIASKDDLFIYFIFVILY